MINKQTKEILDEFYDKILGLEFTCDDQLEDDIEEDVRLVEFVRDKILREEKGFLNYIREYPELVREKTLERLKEIDKLLKVN